MPRFRDKKTGKTRGAFSVEEREGKMYVKFSEGGKEYRYSNIEILDDEGNGLSPAHSEKPSSSEETSTEKRDDGKGRQLWIYSFNRRCYKCGKETEILTYLLFDDGTNDNLVFPWDKKRLNNSKSLELEMLHMQNPEIEYYPILTLGTVRELDRIMMEAFPDQIRKVYSNTQKRKYPMNICQHCGAKQGEYFTYERLNKVIKNGEKLTIIRKIPWELI